MSPIQAGDLFLVQRGATQYHLPAEELLPEPVPWTPAELALRWWFDASRPDLITLRPETDFVQEWRSAGGSVDAVAVQETASSQLFYDATNARGVPQLRTPQSGTWMQLLNPGRFVDGSGYLIVAEATGGLFSGMTHHIHEVVRVDGGGFASNVSDITGWIGAPPPAQVSVIQSSGTTVQVTTLGGPGGSHSFEWTPISEQNTIFRSVRNGNFGTGVLHELLQLEAPLGPGDLERLQGYAAHKWGYAELLPADHPYKNTPPFKS
jgi:hypothetical protein